MKSYISITKDINRTIPIYAIAKYDGSQIRAEWSRKQKAFTKFGSKNVLLGPDHPVLGSAIELVQTKYEKSLTDIFLKERLEDPVCFFEFFGPQSFAGRHAPDDKKDVVLFDVNVYKKGIMYPKEFYKNFGLLDTPPVLYCGNANLEFEKLVRDSTLPEMPLEGVICKSQIPLKKGYPPHMFKIKSNAWLNKLKEFCNGDEKMFEELS
jgi:hypothetical protein